MKLAIVSDTHYGHSHRTQRIHEKFLKKLSEACVEEKVDALIHAGDWISHTQHQLPRTWKMFRKAMGDLPILGVLGNHDHWDSETWYDFKKARHTKYRRGKPYNAMVLDWEEWAEESNIHLLEKNPYRFDEQGEGDTIIYGFNGWYHNIPPLTNDVHHMPKLHEAAPIHSYLNNKAYKDLDWCLSEVEFKEAENENIKKIMVTHMPPYSKDSKYIGFCSNPKFMGFIADPFDALIVGHSHQVEDFIHEEEAYTDEGSFIHKCRVINPGTNFDKFSGGYDKPNFKIIEI